MTATAILLTVTHKALTPDLSDNRQSRAGHDPSPHRCPACKDVIYSRRFGTCRNCGETLPAHNLLGAGVTRTLQSQQNVAQARHRRFCHSVESSRNSWTFSLAK